MNVALASQLFVLVGLIGLPLLGWLVLPHDGGEVLVIFFVLPILGGLIGQRLAVWAFMG